MSKQSYRRYSKSPKQIGAKPQGRLLTLQQILRLELSRGCDNGAVLGGLDRYLDEWGKELKEFGDDVQEKPIKKFCTTVLFGEQYSERTIPERIDWANKILSLVNSFQSAGVGEERENMNPAREQRGKPSPPSPLNELSISSPVTSIKGIGKRVSAKLQNLGVSYVRDLVYHFPRRHVPIVWIKDVIPGNEQGIIGNLWEVRTVRVGSGSKQSTEAIIGDETGNMRLLWFYQPFIAKTVFAGNRLLVTGYLRPFRGIPTFEVGSYEIVEHGDEVVSPGSLVPVYPSTDGLSQRALRRMVRWALTLIEKEQEDYLPQEIKGRRNLLGLSEAILGYHYPSSICMQQAARERLIFDELFLLQIRLLRRRANWKSAAPSIPLPVNRGLMEPFFRMLPFKLTNAQQASLKEILADIRLETPMARLLQGEVGSGKTVVALSAMMVAIGNGYQSALMAPTEVLAEQHFLTITRLLKGPSEPVWDSFRISVPVEGFARPVVVGLLGSMRKAQKKMIREGLASGEIDLIIGTHSLIQEEVEIARLALVVIDEQHRFGVLQRQALELKSRRPHVLSMSATPIPRSLALTVHGDLDVSSIRQLPPGRRKVLTRWLRPDQRGDAYQFIRKEVLEGRQAFIICPLIQESEVLQTRAATEEHQRLTTEIYPEFQIGLLHGRMPIKEKTGIMERFRARQLQILVATPVIEVGVDIPNASVILIEGADRFGLSGLHQFRGRVGRGEHPSYCFLHADDPSVDAQQRFVTLEKESDGFRVAEADLYLRGPGQILGTRQSGLPEFILAGFSDVKALMLAREEATNLLERDPKLLERGHRPLSEIVFGISE